MISDPPFEGAVNCASPYHYKSKTEEIRRLISTAVDGTTGIPKAIKAHAPTVKRVVITSSYAAMIDFSKPLTHVYAEGD